jgi:uncharacterized SAM-binding protein YcdF (DUF218 family)
MRQRFGSASATEGLKSGILVSDGYYLFRAKKMLEVQVLNVYGAPQPLVPHNDLRQMPEPRSTYSCRSATTASTRAARRAGR